MGHYTSTSSKIVVGGKRLCTNLPSKNQGRRAADPECTIATLSSDPPPQRVVSLQPSATVILAAIGRLDRIVACTKYCADVCPQITNHGATIVADSWTASTGQIVAAQPDLVIAAVPYQEKAVTEILKSGARFLGLAPKTLSDIYADIAAIAGIVGALDRGEQVIREMQQEIEAVRRQTDGARRPRVFCEEWGEPLICSQPWGAELVAAAGGGAGRPRGFGEEGGKPLICSQPWVAELVAAAGGEFVGTPGKQTSAVAVLSENPDVVVAAWCGAGDRVPLDKIIRDRGWEQMRAAKENRVYCIRDEFLNTPAPTLVQGLRALAAAIHPEDFPQPAGLRCISKIPLCGKLISQ